MRIFILLTSIFVIISCDDIGNGYFWSKGEASFNRRYGSKGYDYGWNAAYSHFDNGIIIIGERNPVINGKSDLWVIKTDDRGLMQWERKLGGDNDDVGYDIIATSDKAFLLVGYSWSFNNNQQVYVIKIDSSGSIIWEKTFGGSMWDVGNAIIELVDGNYLIAGYSNSPGISSGNTDFYLIKINSNGEIIWENAYGNQSYPNHEWAYDLIETDDRDIIVVGARDQYDKGSKNGLIYRLNSEGKIVWEKELDDENQISETIYSISKLDNGYLYLCSSINSDESPNIYQPRIIKMDGSGNVDWGRVLKSNSSIHHQFRATSTRNGEIVIAGTSSQMSAAGNKEDAFLTKINQNGKILWSNAYGTSDEDDWGWAVFETLNNNLILVGSTKSFGASLFDVYLMGTNSDGIID